MVVSGILTYLEYAGTFPVIPYRTIVLFGIPFCLYTIVYLSDLRSSKRISPYLIRVLTVAVVIAYIFIVILFQHIYNNQSTQISTYNFTILLWYVVAFFIGVNLNLKQSYSKIILIGYVAMVVHVLINLDLSAGSMTILDDKAGIYHFLGDAFAIWSLLTIATYKNKPAVIPILLISTICLYLISSRTSFYGFLLLIPFIYWKNRNRSTRLVLLGAFVLLIGLIVLNFDRVAESRMLRFMVTGNDRSYHLREVTMQQNSKDLIEHWFMGDYAGQLRHGEFGYYIHNYLSFWRQFGIIPFLLFIWLLIPFFRWVMKWFNGNAYQEYDFLFYLTIFAIIEIIFARSYNYHFIWFSIGMITNVLQSKKNDQPVINVSSEQ